MLTAIASITLLFVAVLGLQQASKRLGGRLSATVELCAICAAVSGTWIVLLVAYHGGYYRNEIAIALLVGQSIVGGLYLAGDRTPDRYDVFTLPALLSATLVGYLLFVPSAVVTVPLEVGASAGAIGLLWVITGTLYGYREHDRVRRVFDAAVECCRDW